MGVDVPKTDKEVFLNHYYMSYIRSNEVIPKHILKRFKIDVQIIREENKLYNTKLN